MTKQQNKNTWTKKKFDLKIRDCEVGDKSLTCCQVFLFVIFQGLITSL